MKSRQFEFTISPDEAGERIDMYLASNIKDISRSYIQRLIQEGDITVNGQNVKPKYMVKAGDTISVLLPPPELEKKVMPENIPLHSVYEDAYLLVVNKPPGMIVHPAGGHLSGTLVNALLYHCTDLSGIGGIMRPGIVHRLDKDTSGLLIVAKDDRTHRDLSRQLKNRKVKKIYTALVSGNLKKESGEIATPIGRCVRDRKKMSTLTTRGREALTRFRVIKRFGVCTLVEISLSTGRTHQIRVHMSSIHHPVVGDKTYGGRCKGLKEDAALYDILKHMKRQALHASSLGFTHPVSGKYMEFDSKLPDDMENIIQSLNIAIKQQGAEFTSN